MTFKPLLAAPAELDKLTFPMIASPKIDGIRCLVDSLVGPMSRTLKPIPNHYIRNALAGAGLSFMDGEIVTYTDGAIDDFNTVQSKVMRADGEPEFLFHVFDSFKHPDRPYTDRLAAVLDKLTRPSCAFAVAHDYRFVSSLEDVAQIESEWIDGDGWEGVMLRAQNGRYKFGRSTAREGILVKIKRFEDSEAVIVGTVERMHNANEARKDALGHTERSTHKANLVPMDTLGALSVEWKGKAFEIGTGFDDATRSRLWSQRETLIGQTVTFKYQGVGSQGAPRFPVFLGLRFDLEAVA